MIKHLPTAVLAALAFHAASGRAHAQAQTPNTLTECEKQQGFTLLFDGTLAGLKANFVNYVPNQPNTTLLDSRWRVNAGGWIENQNGSSTDARSKRTYKDFDWRLEYRNNSNQGIFYRFNINYDFAWKSGIEFAIDDNTGSSTESPGAAYGLIPPRPNTYFPFQGGKWNQVRIVAKGDSVEHWMNGSKVVGFRLHSDAFWNAYQTSKWSSDQELTFNVKGNKSAGYISEGYIGFQGDHGGTWQIRTMRISETPRLGPIDCTVGLADAASAEAGRAEAVAFRRVPGGEALDLGGLDATAVELFAPDGRLVATARPAPGAREAEFAADLPRGLYLARIRTPAGIRLRKASLL